MHFVGSCTRTLARHRFSQKTNERICFFFAISVKQKNNKLFVWFSRESDSFIRPLSKKLFCGLFCGHEIKIHTRVTEYSFSNKRQKLELQVYFQDFVSNFTKKLFQ